MIVSAGQCAVGRQPWFPIPVTRPIEINDPRIIGGNIPYPLVVGPGGNLHLPVGSRSNIVRRGWEPYAWAWDANMDMGATIFQWTSSQGPTGPGNEIQVSELGLRRSINLQAFQPLWFAESKEQPDFTYEENIRPQWLPEGPFGPTIIHGDCPIKAAGFLGAGIFPIAHKVEDDGTVREVGAYMVVEGTLNCNSPWGIGGFTPYLWEVAGASYCVCHVQMTFQARPAISVDVDEAGNLEANFLSSDWIFSGIDSPSQSIDVLIATSYPTQDDQVLCGNCGVADETFFPSESWGSIPMFSATGFTITGSTIKCVQHYD